MRTIETLDLFQFDELSLFLGFDYQINSKITIHQPTIKEIVAFGEASYYQMVQRLCLTPSDMKSELDSIGKDWEKVSDFELFMMMVQDLPKAKTAILFGSQMDFSKMQQFRNMQNGEICLCEVNEMTQPIKNGIVIDKLIYEKIASYIRRIHGFKKHTDIAANKYTHKYLVDEDRQKKKRLQTNHEEHHSLLLPLIITLVNTEEFKYNSKTIQDIGIYELTASMMQIQNKKSSLALLQGSYSGMIDTSKIDKKHFNWIFQESNDN